MKKLRILFPLILVFLSPPGSFSQGLLFHANDELISKRSSYNVFENTDPTFDKYLTIKFDLAIIDTNPVGYICFIKDKETNISYSLIVTRKDDLALLQLNIDSKQNLLQIPVKMSTLGYRKWHSVTMSLLPDNNCIEIRFDNTLFKASVKSLSTKIKPQIIFGKHEFVVDVPKIAIRNLTVNGNDRSYTFNLNESEGQVVYDATGNVCGKVENPIWLIKESYHWQLRSSFFSKDVVAANFDPKYQRMILVNRDSVLFFDFSSNRAIAHRLKNSLPVSMNLGMSFIDTLRNKLYVYEVNAVQQGKPTIATLDLSDFSWSKISTEQLDHQRHHHTGFFNAEKEQYTIFGGFGNQKYFNDFSTYDIKSNKWSKITYSGDNISPRFFSGQAIVDKNNVLIFGGIGNETGDQNLGKSYNYDCYHVNLANHTVKKLWSVPVNNSGLVTVRNMVLSEDQKSFYTICYAEYLPNTFLKLYEFSIKNGAFKIVGDSIPMISERIETNANLYRNPVTKELYCTTQEFSPTGSSKIKIYSLAEPPVEKSSLLNTNYKKLHLFFLFRPLTLIVLILIISLLLIRNFVSKRRKIVIEQKSRIRDHNPLEVISQVKKKNSIYLFGEFTVIDKSGKDITYLFSTKIKQLFLYILLNSENNDPGVKSSKIYSTVWPDKPLENAKNLKGVTLNQIRKILTDIDGIELIYTNEYFRLEMQEPFYCDYFDCQKYFEELSTLNILDETILQKILAMVSQGSFLKSLDFDYLEVFKRELGNLIVTIFSPLLEKNFKERNYAQVIRIAQIIQSADEMNKMALSYELVSYQKMDMKDVMQRRYNSFIIKYKIENNKDFPYNMSDLANL